MSGEAYKIGASITWFLIFISSYIYCIAEYGFLLGVGLGWLPSLIVATIFCWLWPLYVLVIAASLIYLLYSAL